MVLGSEAVRGRPQRRRLARAQDRPDVPQIRPLAPRRQHPRRSVLLQLPAQTPWGPDVAALSSHDAVHIGRSRTISQLTVCQTGARVHAVRALRQQRRGIQHRSVMKGGHGQRCSPATGANPGSESPAAHLVAASDILARRSARLPSGRDRGRAPGLASTQRGSHGERCLASFSRPTHWQSSGTRIAGMPMRPRPAWGVSVVSLAQQNPVPVLDGVTE